MKGNGMILEEGLARVIHAANCAWNVYLDDRAPDAPWDGLAEWHKLMIIDRVKMILDGYGPETIHDAWVDFMLSQGWKLGAVKNPAGNPPTHPCLKDWKELPPEQQVKDTMAVGIVKNLAAAYLDREFGGLVRFSPQTGLPEQ